MQQTKTNFWSKMSTKLKAYFGHFNALFMMQFKDKIDFSVFKDKKRAFFKFLWQILLFVGITAIIYFVFLLAVNLGLFSMMQSFNFKAYLVFVTILIIFSFFSCLGSVTNALYFSKDNPVLLTFPIKNNTIFASKLAVCYIYELAKNTTYILPFFIAYGLVMRLAIGYYFWSIFALCFLTLLIVSVCGLLSIPAMAIKMLFKKYNWLQILVATLLVGLLVYAVVYAISKIPADIDLVRDWGKIYWSIQDFLNAFSKIFAPFDYLLMLLAGTAYNVNNFNLFTQTNTVTFFSCIGIILFCALIINFVSKPLFLKMASSPFEYRKKIIKKPHKNAKESPFLSSSIKNSKIIFRTSDIIYGILAVAIVTPILVLLQNQIIGAMNTRMLGNYMTIAFNILIVLLMILSTNSILASAYSREGNSAYLTKTSPVEYKILLTGKLVTNAVLCLASIVASCIVINIFAHIGAFSTILLILALSLIYIAHLLWSAEFDIMNPQNRQYQTTGMEQKNPNESKSTIFAFIISAITAFVCYFLIKENISVMFVKVFVLAIAFFAVRLYFYLTKIKLYYKEK